MLERADDPYLVSVVIPAYNAAQTISETITSALGQTYRDLEVIVVDDGSDDSTKEVVQRHAAVDPRLHYVFQANAGVAAARNRGIAEARGTFIATLDADDLWYPTKIERQIERFRAQGPETALVYAWCCWVSDGGHISGYAPPLRHEGRIFPQMCLGNLIISASNALIRKEALIEAGGFDETLRHAGGQGCEDWKLYLQIAERHEIAGAPEYLIGYRLRPGAMSEDFDQMMRSRRLVEAQFLPRYPELAAEFAAGHLILIRSLAIRAARRGRYGTAMRLLAGYPDTSLSALWRSAAWLAQKTGQAIGKRLASGKDGQPAMFRQTESISRP
jgi:glycosyltransferase involved in cell wall biosynthesis